MSIYKVRISREYFPKTIWPEDGRDYYDEVEVDATCKSAAAKTAWKVRGDRWLSLMTEYARDRLIKVSVNGPGRYRKPFGFYFRGVQ